MSAFFNEGLVERSYHALYEQHFAARHKHREFVTFVPGKEEVFVGFDLGFAAPDPTFHLSNYEFFEWIKESVRSPRINNSAFLFAYFYQYKLISSVSLSRLRDNTVRDGLIDAGYNPYGHPYRAKLDTLRKSFANGTKQHPLSQHEALCRLSRIPGAEVYYCTPKFDEEMGIPREPDRTLNDLTRTPVTNNTPDFAESSPHHLYFEDAYGTNPMWCSKPVPAERSREITTPKLITPPQLLQLFKANYLVMENNIKLDFNDVELTDRDLREHVFLNYLDAMPDCTRIIALPGEWLY